MWHIISQTGIAVFGLLAIILVTRKNKWGFVFGLCSQPFWLITTFQNKQLGIFLLSIIYTFTWAYGVYNWFFRGKKMRKKKIFIVSPVRNVSPEVEAEVLTYVAKLEAQGYIVHCPLRGDTDQYDVRGLIICLTNTDAIIRADEIHVWFDKESRGTLFDLGEIFVLLRLGFTKKVVLINEVEPTNTKSFENVLLALVQGIQIKGEDARQILRSAAKEIELKEFV